MVNIPVHEYWFAIKICYLLVLVVCLVSFIEQWCDDAAFEKQVREDEARIIPGLGEGGSPANLSGIDPKGEEANREFGVNVYLSDRIPYDRNLSDYRHPLCQLVLYDAELPSASVVIIFHNEPYSVLLRTIWSVLNSARRDQPWYMQANYIENATGARMEMGYKGQPPDSPYVYLKEIILVDDNSTLPELKGKLSYYIKTRLPSDMIRVLRLPEKRGLIRARQAGAGIARGDVMIVLDSHCEPVRDWLRPLLQRIKEQRTAVLLPAIDTLLYWNFAYSLGGSNIFMVGGFQFAGFYSWMDMSEREKERRDSDISPARSPTMMGGLFAINREYFWELGGYDEMMSGWGGENLEMSFRVWQCGGTLEVIPCSRVGHLFRSFFLYEVSVRYTHGLNTARMAEVWMDEYAELYYIHRPDLREGYSQDATAVGRSYEQDYGVKKNPAVGDVTQRKALRQKLQCKSFQWYLDNVYPEKFVPARDGYAYGRVQNKHHGMCLHLSRLPGDMGAPLKLSPCQGKLFAKQFFSFTPAGHLRDERLCSEVGDDGNNSDRLVLMRECRDPLKERRQLWSYSKGVIRNEGSKLCLTAEGVTLSNVLAMRCDGSPDQIWTIDYSRDKDFQMDSDYEYDKEFIERQARIWKLGANRRISRSLLSVDEIRVEEPRAANNCSRRRSRRKKQFILRIERTVTPANGQNPHHH